jgi:hypothetical protein
MTGPLAAADALDARLGLRRWIRVATLAVVVVAAGGVVALLTGAGGRPPGPEVAMAPEDPQAGIPEASTVVGPAADSDASSYVQRRRSELAGLAGDSPGQTRAALVTLRRRLDVARARQVLDQLAPKVTEVRYRLPVGESRARALSSDRDALAAVETGLQREADDFRAEAASLTEMIRTTDDPAFAEVFRSDRAELVEAAEAIAAGECGCVYAVRLRASVQALARLAEADPVRLVDVAPAGATAGGVQFLAVDPPLAAEG